MQQDRGRNYDCRTLNKPSNNVFPFRPYQLVTKPSPKPRHNTTTSANSLPQSGLSWQKKANACLLPLPASCPSLHPSVTSFLLFPSVAHPLPSSPSSSLSLLLAFPVLFAYMSELLGHDSALEAGFLRVVRHVLLPGVREGLVEHGHLCMTMHAHKHVGATFMCIRSRS